MRSLYPRPHDTLNQDDIASYQLGACSFLRQSQECRQASHFDDTVMISMKLVDKKGIRRPPYKSYENDVFAEASNGQLVIFPAKDIQQPFKPRRISPNFPSRLVRHWYDLCRSHHTLLCTRPVSMQGLKVIDCNTMRVVELGHYEEYLALSYVWTKSESPKKGRTTRRGTLGYHVKKMSQTVKDAIDVTKSLGFQYLWIDKFCIDQNDDLDKMLMISKMDLVFRGAEITIVAASGLDESYGLPGVGVVRRPLPCVKIGSSILLQTPPSSRHVQRESIWASRAWTYQEYVLSRRCLIFTQTQTLFQCQEMQCQEGLGGPELCGSVSEFHRYCYSSHGRELSINRELAKSLVLSDLMDKTNLNPQALQTSWDTFRKALLIYTARQLSHSNDTINAFTGIMKALQRAEQPLFNIQGLPLCPVAGTNSAFFQNNLFALSLTWKHETEPVQRRTRFPSWTWAGWEGLAYIPAYYHGMLWTHSTSYIEDVQLEVETEPETCMNLQDIIPTALATNRSSVNSYILDDFNSKSVDVSTGNVLHFTAFTISPQICSVSSSSILLGNRPIKIVSRPVISEKNGTTRSLSLDEIHTGITVGAYQLIVINFNPAYHADINEGLLLMLVKNEKHPGDISRCGLFIMECSADECVGFITGLERTKFQLI